MSTINVSATNDVSPTWHTSRGLLETVDLKDDGNFQEISTVLVAIQGNAQYRYGFCAAEISSLFDCVSGL